ncbi:MAG: hypothetical protein ACR2GG_02695 [Gemmatimonadaceae bacterium]
MTSTHDTGVITGVVSGSRGIRRVTSMLRILGACAVVICATASRAPAQQATALTQLDGRVSPALRAQLTTLTDSAFAVGLPVGPLVDKALEGVSKHADDSRIVAAVRAAMTDLGIARRSLGASASEGELTAGVAVLRAGVSASALAAIRRSLPHRPLTVPLSILGALVVQGAPVPSATSTIVNYATRNDDARLLAFGRDIARSIARGVPAEAALLQPGGLVTNSAGGHPTSLSQPSTPRINPPRTKP